MDKFYLHKLIGGLLIILFSGNIVAQEKINFKKISFDSLNLQLDKIFVTKEGKVIVITSKGLWWLEDGKLVEPSRNKRNINMRIKTSSSTRLNVSEVNQLSTSEKYGSLFQGPDSLFYFFDNNQLFIWKSSGKISSLDLSVVGITQPKPVIKIWVDSYGSVYVGTNQKGYFIIEVEKIFEQQKNRIDISRIELKGISTKGYANMSVYSFAQDPKIRNRIWMGTSFGLFYYEINERAIFSIVPNDKSKLTVTEIHTDNNDNLWFSTLEKGMGVYNLVNKSFRFYPYTNNPNEYSKSPVKAFCYKSPNEFYVAILDSLPAIFNKQTHVYSFIKDSVLFQTPNTTTDVKVDGLGNVLVLKGGGLYFGRISKKDSTENGKLISPIENDSMSLLPFFKGIELSNGTPLATFNYKPELLRKIILKHDQNNLLVYCDVPDFTTKSGIEYAWKIDGYTAGWEFISGAKLDKSVIIYLKYLPPGKYKLLVQARKANQSWHNLHGQTAELDIIITTPISQKWWFWTIVILGLGLIVCVVFWWRIKAVKMKERKKSQLEKQMLELEAKALRAQMNPHFIFNCLNSIKSLIQQHQEEKSVNYLTTFSKLIRTLFNNANKKEISLYDEIETCKLYLQMEAMRFDTKFSYAVKVEENLDLKSVQVPALIIQPFIENAIWHGIVPKGEEGHVELSVMKKDNTVEISIDDNGIGREASKQNKPASSIGHQSKGVNLTQSRLELDNLLRQRQAKLEMIDKKDEKGLASGTKVIITINEETT